MLQKEQSLITTKPEPGSTHACARGRRGVPGQAGSGLSPYHNKVATNRYPGFGNQIWHGARLLDGYGEGKNGSTIPLFYPGITVKDIYTTPNDHAAPEEPRDVQALRLQPEHRREDALRRSRRAGLARATRTSGRSTAGTSAAPTPNPRMRRVFRFRNRSQRDVPLHDLGVAALSPRRQAHEELGVRRRHVLRGHLGAGDRDEAGVPLLQQGRPTSTPTFAIGAKYRRTAHARAGARRGSSTASRSASRRRPVRTACRSIACTTGETARTSCTSSTRTVAALRKTAALRRTWDEPGHRLLPAASGAAVGASARRLVSDDGRSPSPRPAASPTMAAYRRAPLASHRTPGRLTRHHDSRRSPHVPISPLTPDSQGKVRDLYDLGDRLLLVASDRLSAFDFVLHDPIPYKGEVLTKLSLFWFDLLGDVVAEPPALRRRRRPSRASSRRTPTGCAAASCS